MTYYECLNCGAKHDSNDGCDNVEQLWFCSCKCQSEYWEEPLPRGRECGRCVNDSEESKAELIGARV